VALDGGTAECGPADDGAQCMRAVTQLAYRPEYLEGPVRDALAFLARVTWIRHGCLPWIVREVTSGEAT
jgi:hypothetical protein